MNYLSCIEIETHASPRASVIWLHGLGASNDDFAPIVPELRLPASLATRFVFPQAPSMPVTVNGGMSMPAWYDIISMDIDRKIDTAQIKRSAQEVIKLIDREIERGVASERIVLAGFSQGGAVVYEAALSCTHKLGGIFALSTYFATHDLHGSHTTNTELPILVCHGTLDPVVPESLGQQAVTKLRAMGLQAEYRSYPMQHEVCIEEIVDISRWIQHVLSGT